MQSEDNFPRPFRFSDPRQARIHQRLSLVSPAAAPFYEAQVIGVRPSILERPGNTVKSSG